MSPLDDLYQELLLEHKRQPRNWGRLARANKSAEGRNPLCGDAIVLDVAAHDGVIDDIAFEGTGCAICIASASLMTQAVKGRSVAEATRLVSAMHTMLTAAPAADDAHDAYLGKLVVLRGVRRFPSRIKCAALAWHALRECLTEAAQPGREPEIHDAIDPA
jgi:nitrogen fixation protein NifU and related proteins